MEKVRFIVRATEDNGSLAEFLAMINTEPACELVDTIGPAEHPHTAVVAVDPEQAPSFEQRFRNSPQLMIERDRPLSLFDKTTGFLHRSERKTNA
jgi:hypothetical protein